MLDGPRSEGPGEHFSDWSRALSREQVAQLDHLLNKRIESRKPLAYLLGHAWFAGIRFAVNENVLVPRSPLAELIEEGFAPWLDMGRLDREQSDMGKRPAVLDLCTGSGCLGLATAWYWPQLRVDCTDISSAALEVAELNRQQLGLQERVQLLQSDLFSALEGRSYDLIVTNPPYVPASAAQTLPQEFGSEPALGLYSGADGLDACLRIMLQSPHYLEPAGLLVCEVGESAARLEALLPRVPFTWLEFQRGGDGVFLLDREQLLGCHEAVQQLVELRDRQARLMEAGDRVG